MNVRVAVVGTGWWATRAHLPALVAHADAEVVALVDPNRQNLVRAAERFEVADTFADTAAMLESVELDAIVIAVPHVLHASLAQLGLEHGLHVLLEKPMTIDPREAYGLLELARGAQRELIIGYPWHYNRQVLALRDAIRSGRIGSIEAVDCLFASVVRELYRGEPEPYRDVLGYTLNAPSVPTYADTAFSGGGQGQWQVTHAAALLQWLTGLEPTHVSAFTADRGLAMDLVDAASIRFAGDAIGTITSTGGVVPKQAEMLEYRIFGNDGHITFDVNAGTAAIHAPDGTIEMLDRLPPEARYPEWAPVTNLVEVARGTGANGSPALLGARTVGLVEAMYRSAATGLAAAVFQP